MGRYTGVRKVHAKRRNRQKFDIEKYLLKKVNISDKKEVNADLIKQLVEEENKLDGSGMIKCVKCGKLMRNPFGVNIKGNIKMPCKHCGHQNRKAKEWEKNKEEKKE